MLRLYPTYQKYLVAGVGLSILLSVLAFALLHNPVLAVLLLLGCGLSWLGAQYGAVSQYQKDIFTLYAGLQPDEFLQRLQAVLPRCKPGSPLEAAIRAQVGNGYIAKGEFQQALEWFTSQNQSEDVLLMQAQNRCSCYLWMGDEAAARRELARMEELMAKRPAKKQQADGQALRLAKVHLAYLQGTVSGDDMYWLRGESSRANYLHQATTRLLLARIYKMQGEKELAQNLLKAVAERGGDIWAVRQARQLLGLAPAGQAE